MIFNMIGMGGSGESLIISDTIDTNGGIIRTITGKAVKLQTKTITPTSSVQVVNPDDGYDGFSKVTVNAGGSVPTGNINISHSGVTDVTNYATATVPSASIWVEASDNGFFTVDGVREWHVAGRTCIDPNEGDIEGWLSAGDYDGNTQSYTAVPANTIITPTESEQTIGGNRYMMEGAVTVSAISSTYVGSGITRRSSTDLTASGATVTVPAGYYSSQATKSVSTMTLPTSTASSATSGYTNKATIGRSTSDQYINIPTGYNSAGAYYKISAVANGSASAPSTISGTSATVSTGTNTLTLTKTVSVTPSVSAGYISSGTATNSSVSLTASVTTKAAATITPSTSNQTIAAGTYLTGAQTIAGDADLVGSNILSTANIFGVQGTVVVQNYYTGSSAPSSSTGSNGDLYLQT